MKKKPFLLLLAACCFTWISPPGGYLLHFLYLATDPRETDNELNKEAGFLCGNTMYFFGVLSCTLAFCPLGAFFTWLDIVYHLGASHSLGQLCFFFPSALVPPFRKLFRPLDEKAEEIIRIVQDEDPDV